MNTILSETVLIIVSFIFILPLILAVIMSIQPPQSVFSFPPKFYPTGFHWQNYVDAFKTVPFGRLLLNSTLVAIMITVGKLITGTLAGYAFSSFKFFGKNFAFAFLFATLFLPNDRWSCYYKFCICLEFVFMAIDSYYGR
jgi:sn-glycerol 3-phosphate transport system permease protein